MTPRRLAPLLLAALLAAGCGSSSTYRVLLGTPGPAAAARSPVRISRGATLPGFDLTEVALVQAVGRGSHADLAHLVEALEAEALSLGCDAIVRMRHVQGAQQAVAVGVAVRTRPARSLPVVEGRAGPLWPVGAPTLDATTDEPAPAAAAPAGPLTAPWQR